MFILVTYIILIYYYFSSLIRWHIYISIFFILICLLFFIQYNSGLFLVNFLIFICIFWAPGEFFYLFIVELNLTKITVNLVFTDLIKDSLNKLLVELLFILNLLIK